MAMCNYLFLRDGELVSPSTARCHVTVITVWQGRSLKGGVIIETRKYLCHCNLRTEVLWRRHDLGNRWKLPEIWFNQTNHSNFHLESLTKNKKKKLTPRLRF